VVAEGCVEGGVSHLPQEVALVLDLGDLQPAVLLLDVHGDDLARLRADGPGVVDHLLVVVLQPVLVEDGGGLDDLLDLLGGGLVGREDVALDGELHDPSTLFEVGGYCGSIPSTLFGVGGYCGSIPTSVQRGAERRGRS